MSPTYCVVFTGWPCLTQSEWASWVQAIGTLIALGLAVGVPWVQHMAAARRDSAREAIVARGLALTHMQQLRLWKFSLDQVFTCLDRAERPIPYQAWQELCSLTQITKTDGKLMRESSNLGLAATYVQEFFFHASLANVAAENGRLGEDEDSDEAALRHHSRLALDRCAAAIVAIVKVTSAGQKTAYEIEKLRDTHADATSGMNTPA